MKSLFKGSLKETGVVDYMIDVSYGEKDWSMSSGIREILANMLDTKTDSKFFYVEEEGYCVIRDSGTGLPKKALVMGASSKSGDGNCIGQFGEGLKMSLVTALRLNRVVSIQTIGYGVEIEKRRSKEYDCDMMRVIYTDNTREIGTEVRMECTREEFDTAVNMFLQFQKGYKELDKNLYLPGGYISILGLTTEERPNMLFSYDLNDKSLTNRDRNVIKSRQLKGEMEKILSSMKSKDAIKYYFDGLKESPESEEYKIAFEPKSKKAWLAVVKEIYGDSVVFSSGSDGDVKAIYKGMTVIPCPTKQVRAVLTAIGLKSSSQKTKALKNEKVQIKVEEENKIVYPIARNYVEDWTVFSAGRELLANALDMSPDATVEYTNGQCVITDKGVGIKRKHFVIGNSEKDKNEIGMFGEGFKMASLVLAREGRNMEIRTVGTTYRPALEMSKEFGTEIFCFYYENNDKKQGTEIVFTASEKEVEEIKKLFICFNKDVNIVDSTPSMDVIDDGVGNIYVNGLCASKIHGLFSYHIKGDKSLVDSRDRNHIDEAKLNTILREYYETTSNDVVISRILTGWEKDSTFKEYSLILEPQMPLIWYSTAEKCFPNCCISSMSNWKANFVAEQAGYRLLKNVPPYILQLLSNTMSTADDISAQYGDDGIFLDDKIVFPITSDYIPNWGVVDALKEFVSNAIDASGDKGIVFKWENGICEITDTGSGLKRENLLIGNSESRSVGKKIGNFGEGLKLACLSLARAKCSVHIDTVGFSIDATLQKSSKFNAEVLVMKIQENTREKGTSIFVHSTEQQFLNTKKLFLCFDENKKAVDKAEGIYVGGTTGLYVNGVLICEINSCFGYSYNITDSFAKHNLSRDRKSFSQSYYRSGQVFKMLTDIKNDEEMKKILKTMCDGKEESSAIFNNMYSIQSSCAKRWLKVAKEVYKDCCLPSNNTESTLVAEDSNLRVLKNIPDTLRKFLEGIKFPKAEEAVREKAAQEKRETAIPRNQLSPEERVVLEKIDKMVATEFGTSMPQKIKIVACLDETPGSMMTYGMYDPCKDTVYLIRALLRSDSMAHAYGVAHHEFTHRKGGHSDRTREFENDLTNAIGELLTRLYN